MEKQATVIVDLDVALAVGPPVPNPWILALQMALKVAPPLEPEPESEPPVPTKAVLAMTEETMQATPSTSRARKKESTVQQTGFQYRFREQAPHR